MKNDVMGSGSLVVIHCLNPPEKLWGKLLKLNALGVVLRGLNLNSVEDWLIQEKTGDEGYISPSTVFIPVHRVERIYIDESTRAAPAIGERFTEACGIDVREALGGESE